MYHIIKSILLFIAWLAVKLIGLLVFGTAIILLGFRYLGEVSTCLAFSLFISWWISSLFPAEE